MPKFSVFILWILNHELYWTDQICGFTQTEAAYILSSERPLGMRTHVCLPVEGGDYRCSLAWRVVYSILPLFGGRGISFAYFLSYLNSSENIITVFSGLRIDNSYEFTIIFYLFFWNTTFQINVKFFLVPVSIPFFLNFLSGNHNYKNVWFSFSIFYAITYICDSLSVHLY